MKKSIIPALLVLLVFVPSCTLLPAQSTQPLVTVIPGEAVTITVASPTMTETPQTTSVTFDTFKDLMILASEMRKQVQLADGKWTENQADGSIQMVSLDTRFAKGDLNADGMDDAALLVAESMGGTGVFYSLTILIYENGSFVQKASAFIDDRPIIHSIEIRDGEVVLNVNVHGLNDPMIDPTTNLTKTYRLMDNRLVTFRQTQLLQDGKSREINITAPENGVEVSREVTLVGDMPIAPFENTLLVQMFDEKNTVSFVQSMMVDAADMGLPATFSFTVSLERFKAGDRVVIQLVEVSMADGSNMTLDSVIVVVK